jgi:UDP-N-acetylmuramate--alanine ligase
LDIYPARELPIPGVSSEMLMEGIQASKKVLINKAQVMEYLKDSQPEVLVTMGAGDIDRLVSGIAEWMNSRAKSEEA